MFSGRLAVSLNLFISLPSKASSDILAISSLITSASVLPSTGFNPKFSNASVLYTTVSLGFLAKPASSSVLTSTSSAISLTSWPRSLP